MTTLTKRSDRRGGTGYLAAAFGVAFALAVAAGFGTWQGTRDRSTTTATSQHVPATSADRQATMPADSTVTIYLLGSGEQAARSSNHQAELVASGAMPQPVNELMLVVSSEEEAALTPRLPAEVQFYSGGSNVRVMDLRTP